jgi:hypothetical protein
MRGVRGLVVVALGLVGCATQGVPEWAMHVRPEPVDPNAQTAAVAQRLLVELQVPTLAADHIAPEQIATVAVREIEQDHQVDAALWLAIASYRYHQETLAAILNGFSGVTRLPPNVRRSAYVDLVKAEAERFSKMGFQAEVRMLEARAYGQSQTEQALQQQLTTLGKTTEIERESLRDALWQLQPAPAVTNRPTQYPELATAFRKRLLIDAQRERQDEHPGTYLARTPIPELQAEAVEAAVGLFDPMLCVSLSNGFPALRPAIVAKLSAHRPEARSNAAATLALAPSAETRAALEARLAVEPDARVKMVIAYALAHHGAPEQALSITSTLQSCQGQACTLPVMLAQWLPHDNKMEIDPAVLARILRGKEFDPRAHLFAAGLARDLGRAKPLDGPTVDALIVAARRRNSFEEKLVADPAYAAIAGADALSREAVLARIAPRSGPTMNVDEISPGPLLARLSRVAEAEDLPLLGRLMPRYGTADGPEAEAIVVAALHVPGEGANTRLLTWLQKYPNVRSMIVVGLAARPDLATADLEQAVQRSGDARATLILKALRHSPVLNATLLSYLRSERPQDKFAAADLAGMVGATDAREDLRQALQYHDARYYPSDAMIRHAAMKSLVRLALTATVKAAPAVTAAAPAP